MKLKFSKEAQTGRNVISASEFRNMKETEETLQSQCEDFLQYYPDVRSIRVPDVFWKIIYGLGNSFLQSITGKAFGGIPDLILIRKSGDYNSCLAVELKVKGRELRQNQRKWANNLNVYRVEHFEDFEKLFHGWYGA
jgi:hypothetical protein